MKMMQPVVPADDINLHRHMLHDDVMRGLIFDDEHVQMRQLPIIFLFFFYLGTKVI